MFHDLEILEHLYATRSINKTAQALGYAQSSISAILKKVETDFNVTLFNRTHAGLIPTRAGEIFYEYMLEVLSATKTTRATLQQLQVKPKVLLSTFLFNFLLRNGELPAVSDTTFDIKSSTFISKSHDSSYNTVITYVNAYQNSNYKQVKTGIMPSFFAVNKTAAPNFSSLPYLVNSDHVCPFTKETYRKLPGNIIEIDSWDSIINLVAQGKGIALLPNYINNDHHFDRLPGTPELQVQYQWLEKKS
ncbi:LysR family transcriptional regulator [Furfurilactobacillus sp. WILCCON 0119]